jgi:thiol-disulfide isomerase/thioredoxin
MGLALVNSDASWRTWGGVSGEAEVAMLLSYGLCSRKNKPKNRAVQKSPILVTCTLLVMFISRHCPYVQHVKQELARLGKDYAGRPLGIVAIAANDVALFPDDAPERLREFSAELGLNYPILFDETQAVAKSYTAACTPDFFLFDADRRLVYRGQLDGSRPKNDVPLTGMNLRRAIDSVLAGLPAPAEQRPSMGCNIKWRPGNEPAYFAH